MSTNVEQQILISRPRAEVAKFALNPDNDPKWISGIAESKMLTTPPVGRGTQVQRVAKFLGRRMEYVTEVDEYDPKGLLVMHAASGPFPMKIRYQFDEAAGGTLARVHVQGDSSGFYMLAGPLLSQAVKRSLKKDLEKLKRLLESGADRT